ncbi:MULTISPECIES: hypothetical protein [Actinomadura]|uniref:FXSXX-COOH protein n=1 Tax=Actinomadura yumaensis TaxID=111807 RepID=A0ABW2CRS3_9ACTN|nr:hypothetical protein [Actinomadura sp. J1-007]MWK36654.1 hypothetical protein [Actinomadura sp. J1-007]
MSRQTTDKAPDLGFIDTTGLTGLALAPLSESALKRALIEVVDPLCAERDPQAGFDNSGGRPPRRNGAARA